MPPLSPTREAPVRLGVLASQFFDPRLGRMGGFGWGARAVSRVLADRPELGIEVVYISAKPRSGMDDAGARIHGSRLLIGRRDAREHAWLVRRAKLDALLTIDYRPSYRATMHALERTPTIIWVRDPRPPEDQRKVASLRLPGHDHVTPAGIDEIDCTSLARTLSLSRRLARPVRLASPAPTMLAPKLRATYGVHARELALLPNPITPPPGGGARARRPLFLFLGRLDPVKRPWLFVELARRFPQCEFAMLGGSHHSGPGGWRPRRLPDNVRALGHVDGEEKAALLSAAWAVVNTSVHESLPVSFLEALSCGTSIVSCQDPEGVASRFGFYTGRFDGDGLQALPRFEEGLEWLLSDPEACFGLADAGRRWVSEVHSPPRFVEALLGLVASTGVVIDPRGGLEGSALDASATA